MNYKHLSLEERHYIEISMKNEKTLTEIATELGRSQSTLSREILRNTDQRGYRHQQAKFSKTMELISVTTKQLFDAVHKINSRPIKCLGFKTPYDVFEQLTGITEKRLTGYALMI